jgi:hypothetical protein
MSKVRVYCPIFPMPFHEASLQTMYNQAKALDALGHDIEIVSWKTSAKAVQAALRSAKDLLPSGWTITVFSKAGPVSGTIKDWISKVQLPDPIVPKSKLSRVLQSAFSNLCPVEFHYYDPSADQRNQLPKADLEIYHYSFSYAWLSKNVPSRQLRVVHFHNIESDLFRLRSKQADHVLIKLIHGLSALKLSRHEKTIGHYVDEVWQHSGKDLEKLSGFIPPGVVHRIVSPTLSEDLFEKRKPQSRATEVVLGFIGGLDFGPNFLSFQWILKNVCPRLSAHGFRGLISQVGKFPERVAEAAQPYKFVRLDGFLEDVEGWWKSLSFLMVPDLSSAGVRMKILEAIASGIPVLANSQAAERLHPEVRKSKLLVVLDTPEEWSKFLSRQTPQDFRISLESLPLNDGVRGSKMYAFLTDDHLKQKIPNGNTRPL